MARRLSGRIELAPILGALGEEFLPREFLVEGLERKRALAQLFKGISNARAHYNTRRDLDLGEGELNSLVNSIGRIESHSKQLSKFLQEDDAAFQIRAGWPHQIDSASAAATVPSFDDLSSAIEVLADHARDRRVAIQMTANAVPLRRSRSEEFTAYLAMVFEENFGKRPGYAREKADSAPANAFIRFEQAVSKQMGLPARAPGSIANDLTNARSRIQELKRARQVGTKMTS
jgi:hypothetical protein